MWVPLVEYNEHLSDGADYFVKQHINNVMRHDKNIDTILLACTHYPLLIPKIKQYVPTNVQIISQGDIVAKSLSNYLNRHPEIESELSKNQSIKFYTTDDSDWFSVQARLFWDITINAEKIEL